MHAVPADTCPVQTVCILKPVIILHEFWHRLLRYGCDSAKTCPGGAGLLRAIYIACFSPQNEFVPQKTTQDFSPHPPLNHIIWKKASRSTSIWKKDSCSQNKLFSLLESVWISSLKIWHVLMLFSKEMIKCWSYLSFKWVFEQMTKYFVPQGINIFTMWKFRLLW